MRDRQGGQRTRREVHRPQLGTRPRRRRQRPSGLQPATLFQRAALRPPDSEDGTRPEPRSGTERSLEIALPDAATAGPNRPAAADIRSVKHNTFKQ